MIPPFFPPFPPFPPLGKVEPNFTIWFTFGSTFLKGGIKILAPPFLKVECMGYNIEVSFNVVNTSSVTELLQNVKLYAQECGCEQIYEDYEFENKTQFIRRHCIISANFSQLNIGEMIKFLKFIKSYHDIYLESIYDETSNILLYASKYYVTQKMDKIKAKEFKIEKRKRSYSEDETLILDTIKKYSKSTFSTF
jgi:hypothetical protein